MNHRHLQTVLLAGLLALAGAACGNTPEIQAILDQHPQLADLKNLETANRTRRTIYDGEPSTFAREAPSTSPSGMSPKTTTHQNKSFKRS